MTSPRELAARTRPAVVLADETCTDILSKVIADAFFDPAVSRWLIPGPAERRRIFPGHFRIYVEHALSDGMVHTTASRDAVALWLPVGEEPAPPPAWYDQRLAAVTGPWVHRFRVFDETLDRHHLTGTAHHHLAILAVRPDRQGRGLGSALLAAHHAALDREGISAYLEASSIRSRRLYTAHGYDACGDPIVLPGGVMFPMVRQPRTAEDKEHHHPAIRADQGREAAP